VTRNSIATCTLAGALAALLSVGPALAAPVTTHSTDFTGFALGSVNGQGGWAVSNPAFDQEVVDVAGNRALRLSNGVTSGAFGNQPFAPRPGGTGMSAANPTNGQPQFFAGESSTGAGYNRFVGSFDFRSVATDATDLGARITVSPDNGQGGRQGFIGLENVAGGVQVTTYDVATDGNFIGPQTIGTVGFGQWSNLTVEMDFFDGVSNDVARILLNGVLVATVHSWEDYFSNWEAALHPLGVPVQTLMFRLSGGALTGAEGFYIDNVTVTLDTVDVPEPGSLALLGVALAGLGMVGRRRASA
jgi:hypothetical protein